MLIVLDFFSLLSFSLSSHHEKIHCEEVRREIGEDDVYCTISGRKCCEIAVNGKEEGALPP